METTLNKPTRFHIPEKTKKIIVDIVIYLFIALFIYTAHSKLTGMRGFKTILSRSPLTGNFSNVIAWFVPLIEIAISVLLIIPLTKKIGLYASLILMTAFTVFLTYGILSGSTLPCHCGGVISTMTWQQHIWFNLTFIILAITSIKLYKKP